MGNVKHSLFGLAQQKRMKGTQCFRIFSISNDLFTTIFTAQMGRGKLQFWVFTAAGGR
jgi:hypothetical protein